MLRARGESQNAMAAQLGRTSAWISRKMTGERGWDVDDLDVLAAYFGVAPAAFLMASDQSVNELAERRRRRVVNCGYHHFQRVALRRVA